MVVDGDRLLDLTARLDKHLAVFGKFFISISKNKVVLVRISGGGLVIVALVIIIPACTRLLAEPQGSSIVVCTVHIADIATAKHVAVLVGNAL